MSKFYGMEFDDPDDDENNDFMIALQIQMQLDSESNADPKSSHTDPTSRLPSTSLVPRTLNDPDWDFIDPCPDIRALFQEYDKLYFWNRLGSCVVEWSKRMTICAGIFYLREGGIIRLSEPLLKFRPRSDLVDTLLHEMIHAYLYLTRNYKDRGEHGDEFKSHMDRINAAARSKITVYHSFHDEVNHARQHVWRCTGTCRTVPPFYGYVKRSMNRAPGKNDTWWEAHARKCTGSFEKIAEPESYKAKQVKGEKSLLGKSSMSGDTTKIVKKKPINAIDTTNFKKIDAYFSQSSQISKNFTTISTTKFKSESDLGKSSSTILAKSPAKVAESGRKRKSDDCEALVVVASLATKKCSSDDIFIIEDECGRKPEKLVKTERKPSPPIVIDLVGDEEPKVNAAAAFELVECPMCFQKFASHRIEAHVGTHF